MITCALQQVPNGFLKCIESNAVGLNTYQRSSIRSIRSTPTMALLQAWLSCLITCCCKGAALLAACLDSLD